MSDKPSFTFSGLPSCPDCTADLAEYGVEANNLVWQCRGCGASFIFDEQYSLKPYFLEIYYPACPECGDDMIASSPAQGRPDTTWTCRTCGETIYI